MYIFWEGRYHTQVVAADRMLEGEHVRVETLTLRGKRRPAIWRGVEGVADNRCALRCQMDAQLVHASGNGMEFDQRDS